MLTESSRYCPTEDYGGYGAPPFNWQVRFKARARARARARVEVRVRVRVRVRANYAA